MNVIATLTTTT